MSLNYLMTDTANSPGSVFPGYSVLNTETFSWQKPRVSARGTTTPESIEPNDTFRNKRKIASPIPSSVPKVDADSTPIQIWEGTVIDIDIATNTIHVFLDAKIGSVPRHTGEISLEWVSEQDRDLVLPGAIFYLTLFKRTKRGSVQNSQELRFRRRPSWSATQIRDVKQAAEAALANMTALPTAA